MGLFFRRCTAEDRDALREFSIQTYSETFAQGNTAEDLEAYLQDAFDAGKLADQLNNPHSEFYFLFSDGKLAGYLKLNEAPAQTDRRDAASLEVERIYVSSEFQGKGFGQYLMEQALRKAKDRHKQYVWLGVWEKNEKAIRFYKRNGFYENGTHSFFMGKDEQTDFIMRRDLHIANN